MIYGCVVVSLCLENVTTLSCYDFVNTGILILTVFGRNVIGKVRNQNMLYFQTSSKITNNHCALSGDRRYRDPRCIAPIAPVSKVALLSKRKMTSFLVYLLFELDAFTLVIVMVTF